MRKFKILAASVVVIIAAFVCSVTAGAVEWTGDATVTTSETYTIVYSDDGDSSNDSQGTLTVADGQTLTVTGNADNAIYPLTISLQGTARLEWNAAYNGSGYVQIDGAAGSTAVIGGSITSSASANSALSITAGMGTVTINGNITNTMSTAVSTSANITTIGGGAQITGAKDGIVANNDVTLNIGETGAAPAVITSNDSASGGYLYTWYAAVAVSSKDVTLNIVNATINAADTIGVRVLNNNTTEAMTLDITNADITAKYGIYTYGAADITIDAGTITSTATDGVGIYAEDRYCTVYEIDVAAGVEISGDTYGLMIAEANAVVTTSGDITSTNGTAIYTIGSLEVTDGAITGVTGIYALDENDNTNTIDISGGTITATGTTNDDSALCVDGSTTTVTISGGTITAADTAAVYIFDAYSFEMSDGTVTGVTGIYAEDAYTITVSDDSSIEGTDTGVLIKGYTEFVMTGGTIEGGRFGINADESNGVIISGGTISAGENGIYIREGRLTISEEDGTTTITATDEDSSAVWVNSGGSMVNISGGTLEAYHAIKLSCGDGGATITGGIFRATGSAGYGIMFGSGSGFNFDTTQGTDITIQGKAAAIFEDAYRTPDYSKVLYYITSEDYDYAAGDEGAVFGINADTPYANEAEFQYVQFLSTPPSYTVTVDGGRVNGNLSATIQAGSLVIITLDNPEGFEEWIAAGIELDDETGQTQEFTMPLNDVTLTASYDNTTYTVTFETNSEDTADFTQTVAKGAKVIYPGIPTKAGSIFIGWYEDDEFEDLFDFSTAITEAMGNTTLYAKWVDESIDVFDVIFETDGGSSVRTQKVADGETATRPLDPTKDGYTFNGWYKDEEYDTAFNFDTEITETTTIYAEWTEAPPAEEPPAEEPVKPTGNTDNNGYTPGAIGPAPNGPASQSELDYILVIATLNKSGSVNSLATAEDISTAARTAKYRGINKIYLKIPQDGTFISAPTMKTLLSAANRIKLTLIYDYYEVKNLRIVETIGGFFLPLSSSSGQILTGLYMGTERTARMEKYVAETLNRTVLGSFETEQTGGWGALAEISLSTKKFGFEADDGTKLEALIYDPRTAKWYRAAAEIVDGKVVFKTTRTGIVVITAVTDDPQPVE
jgi:uncharacterized repeat protein (TIGR02543 family)